MDSKKKALAVLAGGLTLASAVPAMAVEHEFSGWFRAQYINSNFNGSSIPQGNGATLPNGQPFPGDQAFGFFNPTDAPRDPKTANFIEQRTRIKYNAKINKDLKVFTQFEIDYRFWGDTSYDTGRNRGAAIGADTINIETKNAFFEANLPNSPVTIRAGIQGVDDSLKGIFTSADMAGALATCNHGKTVSSVGFFRWNDNAFPERGSDELNNRVPGKETRDFFMVDVKHAFSDKLKVGASYYLVNANNAITFDFNGEDDENFREDLVVNVLGLNGEATFGPVTLDGFVAGQFGKDKMNDRKIKAFAANLGAKAKAGKGTARAEFLYVSGDKSPNDTDGTLNSWYTPKVFHLSESGYYNNEMVILGRDKYAMTTDKSIVYDVNNLDEGVIGAFFGYDLPFTDRLAGSANLGLAWVAQKNDNRTPEENGKYLGTEINAEANYKVMDNFNLTLRGAYVFLGNYFDGVTAEGNDPRDLYDVKLVAQVNF